MIQNLTPERIAAWTGGIYTGNAASRMIGITDIVIDSRKAVPGCVFAAIRGERSDGNAFIPQAAAAGAVCVLTEETPGEALQEACPALGFVTVASVTEAIKKIARGILDILRVPVVGIIGSVGKTSTKEMTAAVLSQKYRVLKTEGNYNNEIGLPLTVFRLTEADEIAVLEMGINEFGEMDRLAAVARPQTCIFTNIENVHLEFLGDRDGVFRAKTEVFAHMDPGGTVIINGEDDKLSAIRDVNGIRPIRYGWNPDFEIWADEIRPDGLDGTFADLHLDGETVRVRIPQPGRHVVLNAMAAAAAGLYYGLEPEEIREGIASCGEVSGRFHRVVLDHAVIIDDCYNAGPASMKASLSVLQHAGGRRVAILGDMFELGEQEAALHAEVGAFAAGLDLDAVWCAGTLARHIADAVSSAGGSISDIRHFETKEALSEMLPQLVRPGDTILVKASNGMHFGEVVDLLRQICEAW